MEENNILTTTDDKLSIMDRYSSLISKTKGALFSGLGYNQKGKDFYNKAYFTTGQYITKGHIKEQVEKGDNIIKDLDKIIQQIDNETTLNDVQKNLIKDRIKKAILLLKYHQNAIYIEAEKAGHKLSNKDRIFYRKEVIKIEKLLYGENIIEREERKNKVIYKLHELYKENNKELNQEEKELWQEKILDTFPSPSTIIDTIEKPEEKDIYIDETHIFDLVSLLLEIEGFNKEDIVKIQIDDKIHDVFFDEKTGIYTIPSTRKKKEIYDYFKKKNIDQKFKIIKQLTGNNSISISKKDNGFGNNHINLSAPVKGKYNITKKVLPIIYEHETSTHIKTGIGNINNIYINDPERANLEEGVALFNEKMAEGKDITELYEASVGDISLFLGEYFDEYDLKDIFSVYFKLTKEKNPDIENRIRRTKMGVPIGEKGARQKDLTYGDSKENIKELEQLTKTPEGVELLNTYAKAIYSTKLGYEAIKNINEVLDGIKSLDELEPNFPIFAGKIIYWKLFKGKLDTDQMLENDLRRFIKTDKKVTNDQKRLLIKIINIIKKYGEEENT